MIKPDVLVLVPIFLPTLQQLEERYTVHKLWLAKDPTLFLKAVGPRIRAVVTTGIHGCEAAIFDVLPKLEIVACFGTPRNTLPLDKAHERSIVCCRTPDAITQTVADLALGLLVDSMRRITSSDRYLRGGAWEQAPAPAGDEVYARSCGIVGFGAIGQAVAKRVSAMDMKISYFGPRKKETHYAYYPDLVALVKAVDVLVICCPLTDQTRGLVNREVLQALGPEGYLINVARGPVVDESALIEALQQNNIAGAGLDVFWDEPRVPNALMELDNVVMVPHIGSNTKQIRLERGRKVLLNLQAHFAGQPVPFLVV